MVPGNICLVFSPVSKACLVSMIKCGKLQKNHTKASSRIKGANICFYSRKGRVPTETLGQGSIVTSLITILMLKCLLYYYLQ